MWNWNSFFQSLRQESGNTLETPLVSPLSDCPSNCAMARTESAGSILRKFAQAGGDPTTARDNKGWTALHLVVIADSAIFLPYAPAVPARRA